MQRSHLAQDVLDALKACLPPEFCEQYSFFRSRGLPPAKCNSITTSWFDAEVPEPFGDCKVMGASCDIFTKTAGLRVVLTRICQGPDLDISLEDAEAACFDDHLDLLEECLLCTDWTQLTRDHSLDSFFLTIVNYDLESEGGAFSAYLEITVVAAECCTPVP